MTIETAETAQTAPSFHWPVRVYYEDTDAGGIVYYANYLRFFERARTEWLRALGVDQIALRASDGIMFVVASAEVQFRRPARLDDELTITVDIAETSRAFIVFAQTARRGGELLARATVKAVCVNAATLAPVRLPASLLGQVTTESKPR